jgi:hypothetical protein
VHPEIGLRVAVEAEAVSADREEDRLLEDGGAYLAIPVPHGPRPADLDGQDLHNRQIRLETVSRVQAWLCGDDLLTSGK